MCSSAGVAWRMCDTEIGWRVSRAATVAEYGGGVTLSRV